MARDALEIEIFANYVLILGQRVERPSRISPSQWMLHWERMSK